MKNPMKPAPGGPCLLILTLLSAPIPALAQPNQKVEALQHYERGMSQLKSKAFREAIAELNQAYELGHEFAVLYDIGQAYLWIDEPARAVKSFKKYLSEGGKHVPSSRRKEVEQEIVMQEGRIAIVIIHAKQEGVMIKADGGEVGRTPLPEGLDLNAGTHVLSASAQGFQTWEQKLELAGGDRRNIEVVLSPAEPTVGAADEPGPPAPADSAAVGASRPALLERRTVGYVLGGVGVAALVVGSVFGVRAISKRNDSDAQCPANHCSQLGVDLNNQAKTSALVADITIGVGLASAAVATYLLLTSPPGQSNPPAMATRRMGLLADVRPGQAGLALRGAW
jgi:hypothetical protein